MNRSDPSPAPVPARPVFSIPVTAVTALVFAGLWGCLSIYSAKAFGESPFYFVQRQMIWLALGATMFLAAASIPFSFYRKHAWKLLSGIGVLLAAVLLFGSTINGMRGWFPLGGGIYLQPGEFAKGFYMLALSILAVQNGVSETKRFLRMFLLCIGAGILLALEPDLGTATLYFTGFVLVFLVSGGSIRYLLAALTAFGLFGAGFVASHPYALDRIKGFLHPESELTRSSWHIRQFQYALAQGGWTGSDSGGALWTNAYLPLPHTDSLYASIVEASGFIGGTIVLTLFLLLALWFLKLACAHGMAADARVFVFAAGMLFVVQALLHISVNVVLLPPTGVTLPVLSYGGSSLLSTMLTFGIIVSAARGSSGATAFDAPANGESNSQSRKGNNHDENRTRTTEKAPGGDSPAPQ